MLCEYGCGLEAQELTNSGKHVCSRVWVKCPANKAKRSEQQSERMKDQTAREKIKKSLRETRSVIGEDGLTCSQRATRKSAATKMTTLDPETGLPISKTSARKAIATKMTTRDPETGLNQLETHSIKMKQVASQIDPATGDTVAIVRGRKGGKTRSQTKDPETDLSIAQMIGIKRNQTLLKQVDHNGINGRVLSARKGAETKRATVGTDGLTIAQRAGIKDRDAKLADIDGRGLNGYDRRDVTMKTVHYYGESVSLWYQGSYEKHFLDELALQFGGEQELLLRCKRGPQIPYFDTTTQTNKIFRPDFILDGVTICEVKSTFVMNREGGKRRLFDKLQAAASLGYTVKLLLDKQACTWEDWVGSFANREVEIVESFKSE